MSSVQGTLVYEHGQASSLIAIVLFALISLLAIFGVLIRYSWDPLVAFVKKRQGSNQHHSRAFFHTQLGAYIASLMLSNALSSISMVVNVQWAADKSVKDGKLVLHKMTGEWNAVSDNVTLKGMLCNTQGILMQIGDTGGAYFTGAIAVHTFNTLVLRNKLPGWICLAASILGWLVAIFMAATPTWVRNPTLGPIYGINGLSCGISKSWSILNTLLHLLPILLGSFVSVIFFTLVFLVLRGTLTIKDGIKLKLNRQHRWSMSSITTIEYQRFIAAVARSMLWYPFAFNILLLPEIIVGLMESSGMNVPFEALVFASTAGSLLGLANALILCNTLRILKPFLDGNLTLTSKKTKDSDMESFFAGAKSPLPFTTPTSESPKNPEKVFIARDSKQEWTPPPRSASKPKAVESMARNIGRMSRAMSLKRSKPEQTAPSPSAMESGSLARPIMPVPELNAMITMPEPALRKNTLPSTPRIGMASAQAQQRKSDISSDGTDTRHTSANESLLSMYLSRSPETEEMDKPAVPPKEHVQPKPKPQPMPLSARPPMMQSSLAPSPLPTLRSARIPAPYAPNKEAFTSNEWAERVAKTASSQRGSTPSTTTMKMERRKSRSLDLDPYSRAARTPATAALRTPTYGTSLTATTPRRDPSLSAVSARTPLSARRLPPTPSRSGSLTPGGYI
ncbi:hypothetical protein BN946_scf184298.g21 [Trametes cinnabarina]|uniref:G-protein coupled receptors family 1 profile domain-containing protein n=1 Tax=Pycnoporus cinnabarinus TaxID=5643 RepID=A0A060SXM2_PYCCI|nr:hypothetical protein BN946_scf184298.g21 [Trametes cinnabarina]